MGSRGIAPRRKEKKNVTSNGAYLLNCRGYKYEYIVNVTRAAKHILGFFFLFLYTLTEPTARDQPTNDNVIYGFV